MPTYSEPMLRLLATIFILTLVFTSCLSLGDGSNTFIKESINNRHTRKAVLFLREAGATVSNSYQVTLTDADEEFDKNKVGNTFTVDTNHGETGLDSASINFIWLGEDKLQIDYDKKLRTFIQQTNVDGVTIVYKTR